MSIINKNNESKGRFKRLSTKDLTENLILLYVNENLNLVNNQLPKIEKLEECNELLLNTFDNLLREVSSTRRKITDNDIVDILNLAYVGKNDLYWTKDKRTQQLIINSKFENCLYEINNNITFI